MSTIPTISIKLERADYVFSSDLGDNLPTAKIRQIPVAYLDLESLGDSMPDWMVYPLIEILPVLIFRYRTGDDIGNNPAIAFPKLDFDVISEIKFKTRVVVIKGYSYNVISKTLREKIIKQNGFKIHHPSFLYKDWKLMSHGTRLENFYSSDGFKGSIILYLIS